MTYMENTSTTLIRFTITFVAGFVGSALTAHRVSGQTIVAESIAYATCPDSGDALIVIVVDGVEHTVYSDLITYIDRMAVAA